MRRRRITVAAAFAVILLLVVYLTDPGGHPVRRSARTDPTTPPAPSTQPTTSLPPVSAPFTSTETAAWVAAENAQPGTSAWQLSHPATAHQIEGYTGAVSVDVGNPVALFVSTPAPNWSVAAYRMGWYGGAEGRLVWQQSGVPGLVQPPCPMTAATRTVSCSWLQPVAVPTTGWPPGDYLLKLVSSTGFDTWVPLTVRDDSSHAAYLINNSVTTWEAYNTYGGLDLYQGANGALATRAYAVSFDRPYVLGNGEGDFDGLELPMVAMMESHDLDVSYTTDVDLAANPALLANHRAFISLGHDEYYSLSMFQGLEAARAAGVNLVFLGANAVYRHIRLAPTATGPDRLEIDYKSAALDPLAATDPADTTAWSWRAPPTNMPESALLGEMWQCNPVRADMVITDPGSWIFAGTGLAAGSRLPGVIGPEYDHYSADQPNPGDVSVVASSPVDCNGRHSTADMTYYSWPASQAGVWDTGTIDWVGRVQGSCPTCDPPTEVTRITDNVLAAYGTGPAGLVHPTG